MAIKSILTKLAPNEWGFFRSAEGINLANALDEFNTAENKVIITESVENSFKKLTDAFQQTILTADKRNNMQVIGNRFTPDSFISYAQIHVTPDYRYGDFRHSFNVMSYYIAPNHSIVTERPLPVRIALEHVDKRFKERTNLQSAFMAYESISTILSTAATYAWIFDKDPEWQKLKQFPFAIAGNTGLFLGVVVPTKINQHLNRIYYSSQDPYSTEKFSSPYRWIPKSSAEIRTFIGKNDFKPAQAALYNMLKRYLDDYVTLALFHRVASYQHTHFNEEEEISHSKNFTEAEEIVKSLTNTRTWKSGVRAPDMVYLGQGIIKPR